MQQAENSPTKQPKGRPFPKGQSGNPSGKPKGALNHSTRAVMALLDGEVEALTRKAVDLALSGDTVALRLCFERLAPPVKDKPISVSLPPLGDANASQIMSSVLSAMACGEITPSEAAAVAGVVETYRRSVETAEIESRLSVLEGMKL